MQNVYEGKRSFIFISYTRKDRDRVFVEDLSDALNDAGYYVWYDRGIPETEDFHKRIGDRIHACAYVVFVASHESIESVRSGYCKVEIDFAIALKKKMLIVCIDDVNLDAIDEIIKKLIDEGTATVIRLSDYDSVDRLIAAITKSKMLKQSLHKHTIRKRLHYLTISVLLVFVLIIITANVLEIFSTFDFRYKQDELRKMAQTQTSNPNSLYCYDWDELKDIADEIAAADNYSEGIAVAKSYGLVSEDGNIIDGMKPFELSDGTWTSVRIVGFRHDPKADGDIAGITFEFTNCPVSHCMNSAQSNSGGWEKSKMRTWLNSDFIEMLPEGVRAGIVAVKKLTNNQGYSIDDSDVVDVTLDRIWLLSLTEIYGNMSTRSSFLRLYSLYDEEGDQYKYYSDLGASASRLRFFSKNGPDGVRSMTWWLRTPVAYNSNDFHNVFFGTWGSGNNADMDLGVSPAFCF